MQEGRDGSLSFLAINGADQAGAKFPWTDHKIMREWLH